MIGDVNVFLSDLEEDDDDDDQGDNGNGNGNNGTAKRGELEIMIAGESLRRVHAIHHPGMSSLIPSTLLSPCRTILPS